MADIVREDIVQITFDIDDSPLQEILKELKQLKASIGAAVDTEPFDEMKDSANDVKKSVSEITDEVDDLKKGTDKAKSGVKEFAQSSLEKLKANLKKITTNLTEIAKKAGTTAVAALKKLASVSFKALSVGIAGAAMAIGGLVAKSVSAYADFEQLKGGVETLFGAKGAQNIEEYAKIAGKSVSKVEKEYKSLMEAQNTVLVNANDAYKTAGLSANDYMETVTSFSASLISSLKGDTKKAAEYAHTAIVDMSDNANKMGTDMGLLQNAYSGFAKQNYTMLDNLKLGKIHYCRV